MTPLKITVAPNGARRGKSDHPELPVSRKEIIETAVTCHAAGAKELHLHIRDAAGTHSLDSREYLETVDALAKTVPGMTVQVTTESAGIFNVPDQFACLKQVCPSAASVSVREMARDPELAPQVYAFAAENGIKVQHILYEQADLNQLNRWLADGTVPNDMRSVILVFGKYAPPQNAQPEELPPFVEALNGAFPDWTVCAFGQNEHAVLTEAIRLGGHVRVGFENNLCRPDGTPAKNNAENVARIVATAREMGRPILN